MVALVGAALGLAVAVAVTLITRKRKPAQAACWIDNTDYAALGAVSDEWLRQHVK